LLLPDITAAAALSRQYNSLPQNKKNIKKKMAGKSNYKIQRELRSLRSQWIEGIGEMWGWESVGTRIYRVIGLPGFNDNLTAGYFYFSSCHFV